MNKNYLLRRIEKVEEDGVAPPNADTLSKFDEQAGELYWNDAPVVGSVGDIAITDVTGLQAELDDKAPLVHTHTIADVQNLSVELNSKADVQHTHVISDVTGLETALLGKASVEDLHSHANKAVLDGLSDQNGELLYNDSPIGTTTLTGLTDTPTDYGSTGQVLAVDGTGQAVEWVTPESGSSGSSTYLELTDTPESYTGSAGKVVSVKTDETGLEFIDAPSGGGGASGTFGSWTPEVNNVADSEYIASTGYYFELAGMVFINCQVVVNTSSELTFLIGNLPVPIDDSEGAYSGTIALSPTLNNDLPTGGVGAWINRFNGTLYIITDTGSPAKTLSTDRTGVNLSGWYKAKPT